MRVKVLLVDESDPRSINRSPSVCVYGNDVVDGIVLRVTRSSLLQCSLEKECAMNIALVALILIDLLWTEYSFFFKSSKYFTDVCISIAASVGREAVTDSLDNNGQGTVAMPLCLNPFRLANSDNSSRYGEFIFINELEDT